MPKYEKTHKIDFFIFRAYTSDIKLHIDEVGEMSNKIAFFIFEDKLITIHRAHFNFLNIHEEKHIKSGFNKGYTTDYYIFDEICNRDSGNCNDGLDRYGLCCYIYDGESPIIKTRYSDYPW